MTRARETLSVVPVRFHREWWVSHMPRLRDGLAQSATVQVRTAVSVLMAPPYPRLADMYTCVFF